MAFFDIENVKVAGLACAVPDDLEKTTDYYQYFDKDYVDKFIESSGIKSRYTTRRNGLTASDLCYVAAEKVLTELDYDRDKIDVIIYVSAQRDYYQPITACILQARLGLSKECIAYDAPLGCSAYVYGLYMGATHINAACRSVLILSGFSENKISQEFIPPDTSYMLFGSAGSATLLEYDDKAGNIYGLLRSDGYDYKMIIAPFGRQRNPLHNMVQEIGVNKTLDLYERTHMDGMDVVRFTLTTVMKMIKDFKKQFAVDLNDYDVFVLHQANKLILDALIKKNKLDSTKVPISIEKYANTNCASVPVTLADYLENNDMGSKKLKLITSGFGVGLSLGIVAMEMDANRCFGIVKTSEQYDDGITYDFFDEVNE